MSEYDEMPAGFDSFIRDLGGEEAIAAPPQVTWCWRTLDQDTAMAVAAELAEWVAWMVGRYEITSSVIPTCWPAHGHFIEELQALYTAWQVSFDPKDGGLGPIGWHERFWLALERLRERNGCASAHHPFTFGAQMPTPDEAAAGRLHD